MRLKARKSLSAACEAVIVLLLAFMLLPQSGGIAFHIASALAQTLLAVVSWVLMRGERENNFKRCAAFLLVIYTAHLGSLLFFDANLGRHMAFDLDAIKNGLRINLRPFFTISSYIKRGNIPLFAVNIVGNALALAPLGVLLPLVFEKMKKLWLSLLVGAAVIISIEIVQILFGVGSCDIDDFILNFAGYAAARLAVRYVQKRHERLN